ncbi:olfactory receptor 11L1-like [Bombina bombina]|uniref:olfactory receptor 11L1-like n=1 Tax=Bombina bombina TaxID=8345 RepID=UPI00235A6573|nr:olfactory receptor 11L1-like [Bombina bombina]
MPENNQSDVTEFLLLGFTNTQFSKWCIFLIILPLYNLTVACNLLIITLVLVSPYLKFPMYYFLSNLCLCDVMLTTNIVPNMLVVIWRKGKTISFGVCLLQFYIYGVCGGTECLLLGVMSYDRYLAICNPLRYASIMNFNQCLNLIFWSWFLGSMATVIPVIMISFLEFAGTNTIDHLFCDLDPLLQISCSETYFVKLEDLIATIPVICFPLFYIVVSYIHIFITVLNIPSTSGRQKVFSTCSSHLTVVCAYYGTMITIYTVPSKTKSGDTNKFLSLIYTVVTPLLNPVIYGLRSKDIQRALKKLA